MPFSKYTHTQANTHILCFVPIQAQFYPSTIGIINGVCRLKCSVSLLVLLLLLLLYSLSEIFSLLLSYTFHFISFVGFYCMRFFLSFSFFRSFLVGFCERARAFETLSAYRFMKYTVVVGSQSVITVHHFHILISSRLVFCIVFQ